jgi:hypothetical protein
MQLQLSTQDFCNLQSSETSVPKRRPTARRQELTFLHHRELSNRTRSTLLQHPVPACVYLLDSASLTFAILTPVTTLRLSISTYCSLLALLARIRFSVVTSSVSLACLTTYASTLRLSLKELALCRDTERCCENVEPTLGSRVERLRLGHNACWRWHMGLPAQHLSATQLASPQL